MKQRKHLQINKVVFEFNQPRKFVDHNGVAMSYNRAVFTLDNETYSVKSGDANLAGKVGKVQFLAKDEIVNGKTITQDCFTLMGASDYSIQSEIKTFDWKD